LHKDFAGIIGKIGKNNLYSPKNLPDSTPMNTCTYTSMNSKKIKPLLKQPVTGGRPKFFMYWTAKI